MNPVCMICMAPKVETNPGAEIPHQRWSCQSDVCRRYAEMESRPVGPFFKDVPGGHNESRRKDSFHRNFDSDMDAYEKARKEGLRPKATSKAAVVEAQEQVRSHKRALDKLSKVADVSELKTVPGVN